jgi:hypothetical protein
MTKYVPVSVENRLSWSWSYGSWIYNYLYNQCLSPLKLWVRIPLRLGVLDKTLCDKVCQRLVTGRWCSPGTLVSSTNKSNRHDITEILLKMALNTNQTTKPTYISKCKKTKEIRQKKYIDWAKLNRTKYEYLCSASEMKYQQPL